jgi:hypothetical protein
MAKNKYTNLEENREIWLPRKKPLVQYFNTCLFLENYISVYNNLYLTLTDLSYTWKQTEEDVVMIFDQEGFTPNQDDLDVSYGDQYVLIKFPGMYV